MRADQLVALAERVEKATGPDRELDVAIAGASGVTYPADPVNWPPHYTASLDAALTLAPCNLLWVVDCWGNARVGLHNGQCSGSLLPPHPPQPALALCAAVLRALAAGDGTP